MPDFLAGGQDSREIPRAQNQGTHEDDDGAKMVAL